MRTIANSERSIRAHYKKKQETQEQEAWERMKINAKFFFKLAKTKAHLRVPISPFMYSSGKLLEEEP